MQSSPNVIYPTPEEIMAKPVDFKEQTIKTVQDWKKNYYIHRWGDSTNTSKVQYLRYLINMLASVYNLKEYHVELGYTYAYSPADRTICLDMQHPSIISTLHEFKHAISGPSETAACRWSIWLFKEVFPQEFDKLEFLDGSHLLVKKST